MAIQLIANVEQQQPKLIISTMVAMILLLAALPLRKKKISGVFLIASLLTIIDCFIGFIPGINTMVKTWIEQSTTLTLATIISLLLIIGLDEENKIELFYKSILFIACLIFFSALYELIYLNTQPGRIITGYQNISSSILLISIPILLRIKNINQVIKLIISTIIFFVIVFIFKSRFSSIIGLLYFIYIALNLKQIKRYYKLVFILSIIAIIAIAFSYTNRFANLIVGNDLWVRLFIWERLFTAGMDNLLFGIGFGAIPVLTSSWQFINPSVELITTFNTFFSAHNDLLERFIYGGIISLIISIFLNVLIIYGYFKNKKYELNAELIIYLILWAHSLIDIHNSNLPSLLLFNFFQFYLIYKIYENSRFSLIHLKFTLPFLLVPGFTYFFYKDNIKDYVNNYQLTTNSMISGNFNEENILWVKKQSPHFMRFDFIDMQTYLMYNSGKNFNKAIFEQKLLSTRRYNKYYLPQIHVSSQYYSFINDDINLLAVYSDFLYYKLVNLRIINISKNPNNVQVRVSENKSISAINDNNTYVYFVPRAVLDELKRVNSSFGSSKLSSFFIQQNLDNFIYTGVGDSASHKIVAKEFFEGINTFSDKFIFK